MPWDTLLLAASILLLSSFVQSVIGFAFNLLAVPLLIWSGLSLAQAVALTSVPILVQVSVATWKLRREVVWRDVLPASAIRYLTLPIGISLLYLINRLDPVTVKQIVGAMLLLILASQRWIRITPRERLPLAWDLIAFGLSGIMLGMIAMGGPPVVLWLMAHDWSALRTRAFMAALFLMAAPVQLALLYWKLGPEVAEYFLYGLLMTPLVIAGSLAGIHLGNRLDRERLRRLILFFLFLTGVVSLMSPIFK
ncbi:sulfite exporter TauE/SafE family protein [Nitratifractor sp.]|uniref:sulfite exporter TauE/SafE family protein n=1 Tax=Nitratifractor sp. TaxID=2268144 RepID=UPI0025EC9B52|nr:sulfite exporter TauE/SafE family protein [Nitratifractor sp.]